MNLLTFFIGLGIFLLAGILSLLIRPDGTLRGVLVFLRLIGFRVKVHGKENIPASGAVLLISNHISLIDMILIQGICKRRVHFMVRQELVDYLPTRLLFWSLDVLKVPDARHPKAMMDFFKQAHRILEEGSILCFFPEGGISGNGGLMRFKTSAEPLLPEGRPVTVIPMRIGMLWGRLFRLHNGKLHLNKPRTWPIDFNINIGAPVPPTLTAFQLRQRISELGAEAEMGPQPGETPLHTAFALRAKRHPFQFTYADADGTRAPNLKFLIKIAVLSRKFRELDPEGSATYTGVLLPNCLPMTATLFGVMFSDRTPAILNFSAGRDVALESVRRAGVRRIITSRKFLDKLNWEPSEEMVFLEDLAATVSRREGLMTALRVIFTPTRRLVRKLAPRSGFDVWRDAVLLFSSGSTGKPKGVMLTHRNINSDLWAFWRMVDWSPRERLSGNLPLFHAYGYTVLFAFPALSGTPVCYVANPLDAAAVVKSFVDFKVTLLTATPTFLAAYMRKATHGEFRSLRLVITGAEKLRPELSRRFRELTGLEIVEGYGCTELSPIVTINLCNSIYMLGKHADHPGSIGVPMPGIHLRVLSMENGREVGANVSGRLQVKSGTVMKGYLNNPEATAKVIRNGYYDTGDIAKIDEDGYVYITGRASRFSKIGGEMVPHEILEQQIAEIRNVEIREVAVAGRSDPRRGERLVVFYIGDDFDPAAVIEGLRAKKLPNLWIPKLDDFVKIDALPLLGSGKIDLRKLKSMAESLSA